jgi:glutamine amidotransferase/cyclase
MITLLDYGAGNVRSVINALERAGESVVSVDTPADIDKADRLVFPGVGNFGAMMQTLRQKQLVAPLLRYLQADRPFFGICVALQALFESSEEASDEPGLGFLPGRVKRFTTDLAVPHIGWNGIKVRQPSRIFNDFSGQEKLYFVHTYHVEADNPDDVLTVTDYGYEFVSSIQKGNIIATKIPP